MVEQPIGDNAQATAATAEGALEESLYSGLLRLENHLQALGYDLLPIGWRGSREEPAVRNQEYDDIGHVRTVLARDVENRGKPT